MKNRKLYNLLHTNTFLVNSSLCIVLLLCLCYLGFSSPVKKTYSIGNKILSGEYKWRSNILHDTLVDNDLFLDDYDLIQLEEGKAERTVNINYSITNGENKYSFGIMQFLSTSSIGLLNDWQFRIGYKKNETCDANHEKGCYMGGADVFFHDDMLSAAYNYSGINRTLYFYNLDDSGSLFKSLLQDTGGVSQTIIIDPNQSVSETFYNWFNKVAIRVDKCYYNDSKKLYEWNNDPSVGPLQNDLDEESCNNKNYYEIKFDANGGIDAPSSQTKTKNVNLPLTTKKPTYGTYEFKEWNTKSDGSGTSYNSGDDYSADIEVTLYAQWQSKIDYNANGGIVTPTSEKVDLGNFVTLPTPTRTDYDFVGWFTAKSDGEQIKSPYKPTGNIKLYAQWKKVEVDLGDYSTDNKYILLDFDDTISDLEKNINVSSSTYKVVLPDKIATGQKITVVDSKNEKYDEYMIVLTGDVDGDADIGVNDYIRVYNHLDPNDSFTLDEIQQKAADLDGNDKVGTMDYVKIYDLLQQ